MGIDYSFLRLSDTFAAAKDIGNPINSDPNTWQQNQVHLLPTESYLQFTNSATDIAFDGDFLVEIIDCAENVKADITSYVGIDEFTDKYGIQQLAFEIAPLGIEFNGTLYLRFTHTTGLEIWYSTPFVLSSNNAHLTSRFDYKGYGYFNGMSYDRRDYYQSIRVRCFYDKPANVVESESYNQITRYKTVSSRARTYRKSDYRVEYLNPFITDALQTLFEHDVIYIDGVRITDKPVLEHADRLGNSNIFVGNFTASIDKTDTYNSTLQIIQPLTLIVKLPLGIYFSNSIPQTITGTFNKDVTLLTGTVKLYDVTNNVLMETFTQADLATTDNGFTIDISGLITANGDYSIEVSVGLFESDFEVSGAETWAFEIKPEPQFIITDITGDNISYTVNFDIDNIQVQYRQQGSTTWITNLEIYVDSSPLVFENPLTGIVEIRLMADDVVDGDTAYSNTYTVTI